MSAPVNLNLVWAIQETCCLLLSASQRCLTGFVDTVTHSGAQKSYTHQILYERLFWKKNTGHLKAPFKGELGLKMTTLNRLVEGHSPCTRRTRRW